MNKDTALLHLPAEVFIEYQLAAQQATPEKFVTTVAYGDDGPWYIPTAEAYPQGGYEVSVAFCKPGIARKGVTDHWTRLAVLSAALPRDASMLKDLLEDKTLTSSAGPSKLLSPLALKPASSFSQAGMHTVENCVMKSSNCYWHVKNDSVPCSMLWSREKLPPTNSTRYGGTCLLPTKHTDITTRAKKLFSGADSRAGVLTRYKEVPSLKGDSAKENSFTNPSASLATSSAKKASSIWLPISPSSPDGMPNAS